MEFRCATSPFLKDTLASCDAHSAWPSWPAWVARTPPPLRQTPPPVDPNVPPRSRTGTPTTTRPPAQTHREKRGIRSRRPKSRSTTSKRTQTSRTPQRKSIQRRTLERRRNLPVHLETRSATNPLSPAAASKGLNAQTSAPGRAWSPDRPAPAVTLPMTKAFAFQEWNSSAVLTRPTSASRSPAEARRGGVRSSTESGHGGSPRYAMTGCPVRQMIAANVAPVQEPPTPARLKPALLPPVMARPSSAVAAPAHPPVMAPADVYPARAQTERDRNA